MGKITTPAHRVLRMVRTLVLAVLMPTLTVPHSSLGAQHVTKSTPRSPVLEAAMDSVIGVLDETGLNGTFETIDAIRKDGAIDISLYSRGLLGASKISRAVCQPHRAVPPSIARTGNNVLKYMLFQASNAVLDEGIIAPVVITSGNFTQSEVSHRHLHDFQDYSDLWMLGYANNERADQRTHIRTEFFTIC